LFMRSHDDSFSISLLLACYCPYIVILRDIDMFEASLQISVSLSLLSLSERALFSSPLKRYIFERELSLLIFLFPSLRDILLIFSLLSLLISLCFAVRLSVCFHFFLRFLQMIISQVF